MTFDITNRSLNNDAVLFLAIRSARFQEFNLSVVGKDGKEELGMNLPTEGNLTIFIKITNANMLFNLEISVLGFYLSHIFAYIRHRNCTCLSAKGKNDGQPKWPSVGIN